MANRFPLIANPTDAKMYELAAGDNLDLTGSGIYNNGATLTLPTATGTLATLAGTETLTNKTISSGTLSGTFAGDHTYSGTVTLSATTALVIPVGTTAQRPTASTGQIRFNSSLTSFEGYNGTAWSSLGGVKSVDGFTYILAETSSGASNGELEFYAENAAGTAGVKQGGWNYTRLLTNTPVDFAGSTSGTTRVQAAAAASGTLTLPSATDTLVGKATTDTLTNKTINLANNTLTATSAQILAAITDESGSGHLVFDTSPTFTTAVLADTTTFNVFNTTATTINAFGAATTLSLGAGTGTTTVNNNLTVTGNLVVNGTTTTINSTTLTVDDIVVELGDVATPTDTTANGGGILLKGATNKTLLWQSATAAWTSSEDLNLASGKVYEINGTTVLSASALGTGVTGSSLTSVGTLTSLSTSGQITSTVATGTAPLVVASTTKVTNLNVELVDGYHADEANNASTLVARNASKQITSSGLILSGSTSGTSTLVASAAAGTTTHTLPTVSGTIVTSGDTGTVTNTMLAGSIANAKLANSTISGVSLGGTLNTLTLNVSGTGLSGSTTYNGSAAATFTVTSNATSANTASAVVARDASGNFSAGTITAALSGNASTATTLQTARNINGVSFNGSANITVEPYVENDDTTDANRYITFVDSSTPGHQRLNEDSNFTYNPATGTVSSVGGFAAPVALMSNNITTSYSIPVGYNAISAGPIAVASGVSVTVPSGSVWTIV